MYFNGDSPTKSSFWHRVLNLQPSVVVLYFEDATGIFKLHNKYFLPHDDVISWEFRLHSGAVNLFLSPELLSAHLGLGLGLGRFLRQTKQTP